MKVSDALGNTLKETWMKDCVNGSLGSVVYRCVRQLSTSASFLERWGLSLINCWEGDCGSGVKTSQGCRGAS